MLAIGRVRRIVAATICGTREVGRCDAANAMIYIYRGPRLLQQSSRFFFFLFGDDPDQVFRLTDVEGRGKNALLAGTRAR